MDISELREMLRKWGTYDEHVPDIWDWRPLPVDKMTDEEVLAAAHVIARVDKHD